MKWSHFLFSFEGRITRRAYWLRFVLPLVVIHINVAVVVPPSTFDTAEVVLLLATFWPSIAIGTKRCHDRDRSGWFQLISLIPVIGSLWLLIELGFLPGTTGPNRFGPPPHQ